MITICRCSECGDAWEYKGQELYNPTQCYKCGKWYAPKLVQINKFVWEAIKRVKGE